MADMDEDVGPFVLNLCPVTEPIAIPHAFVTQAEVTFAPEHHATLHLARRRERSP